MKSVGQGYKSVPVAGGYGSKEWANELLRWFLREILYADTWKAHPYYKILIGSDIAERLDEAGFWWQAERVRNHLHRWMKSIACTAEGGDTLSNGEREEASL